jgi:hypothetical protein
MPIAVRVVASFPSLVLAAVGLGESRNSERKADGQGEKRKNGFHGTFPLRRVERELITRPILETTPVMFNN